MGWDFAEDINSTGDAYNFRNSHQRTSVICKVLSDGSDQSDLTEFKGKSDIFTKMSHEDADIKSNQ